MIFITFLCDVDHADEIGCSWSSAVAFKQQSFSRSQSCLLIPPAAMIKQHASGADFRQLNFEHAMAESRCHSGRVNGRAYSHRIPLAELKCMSPKRVKELDLFWVWGARPGGGGRSRAARAR